MPRIVAVAPVVPEYVYPQHVITAELSRLIATTPQRRAVMHRLHGASGIGTRHTAMPLENYEALSGLASSNDVFIEVATELAERAVLAALAGAGLRARDVDYVFFTSVTGFSAPSIDGLLVSRLGLRPDIKRVPSFGLGCVAGASALARVNDYLLGHPREVGLVISVELCSLTLQRGDESMANFVATGLFGDGAAAVVMVGDARAEPGIAVIASRSRYYPETRDVIGWNVGNNGFEIVLSAGVADVIEQNFLADVTGFLGDHQLTIAEVGAWVAHPGGPRVLEAFASALGVAPERFALSWASLEKVGNLSSAAVLHVLADTIEQGAEAGALGLLFALGPGVSAEFVLLEWP